MRNKFAFALATLAMISLLSVSALADCSQREHGQRGSIAGLHGAWMLLIDDATRDDFENMTIAEIDALKQQKMQELENMTLTEIEALKQEKMQGRENMTLAELKSKMPMGKADRCQGSIGVCPGEDNFCQKGNRFSAVMGGHLGLLMDDVTKEDLKNMTLAEIKDMRAQEMQKLQNMTLAEIEALKQQKTQERSNMTLSELKEQGAYRTGMAGPMRGFADMGHNGQDGQQGHPGLGSRK